MKLQEFISVFNDTQQLKVVSSQDKNTVIYEGIKAGCIGGFSTSNVKSALIQDDFLVIEADYEMAKIMASSDEELFDMYFDESDLDVDLEELEQKLYKLSGGFGDIFGDL